jgi:PqqD family protein of HPr-rel-A system
LLTAPVSSITRWRSRAPADVVWFDIPPDFIAFHRPSGKTHFLNEASKVLLTELLAEPKELAEILNVFPIVAEEGGDNLRADKMQDLLVHLEALGLIERA